MLAIPEFERLKLEDVKFESSMGYLLGSCTLK
jgi:hypothetical protein